MVEIQFLSLFLRLLLVSMLLVLGRTDIIDDVDSAKVSNKSEVKVNSHEIVKVSLLVHSEKKQSARNFVLTLHDAPHNSRSAEMQVSKMSVVAERAVVLEWEEAAERKREHDHTTQSWKASSFVTFLIPRNLLVLDGSDQCHRSWLTTEETRSAVFPSIPNRDTFVSLFAETGRTLIVSLWEHRPFSDPILLTRRFVTLPFLSAGLASSMVLEEVSKLRHRDTLKHVAHVVIRHAYADSHLKGQLGVESHRQIEYIQNLFLISWSTTMQMKLVASLFLLVFVRFKALAKFRRHSACIADSSCGASEDGPASLKHCQDHGSYLTEGDNELKRSRAFHSCLDRKRSGACFPSSCGVDGLQDLPIPSCGVGTRDNENMYFHLGEVAPREKTTLGTVTESEDLIFEDTKEPTKYCSTISRPIECLRAYYNSHACLEKQGIAVSAEKSSPGTKAVIAALGEPTKGEVDVERKSNGLILCGAGANDRNALLSFKQDVAMERKLTSTKSYVSTLSAQSQVLSSNSESLSPDNVDCGVLSSKPENNDHSFSIGTSKRSADESYAEQLEAPTLEKPSFLLSTHRSKKRRRDSDDLPPVVVDKLDQGNEPGGTSCGKDSPGRRVRPYATSQILPDWVPSRGLQSASRSFIEDSPWT